MSSTNESAEIVQQEQHKTMSKKYVASFELYLKPEELTPQRCQRIVKYARKRLRGQDNNSVDAYDNSNSQVRIPVVNHQQIELGKQLGKGAFSSVYAIRSISKKNKKGEDASQEKVDNMVVKFLRTKLYDNHGLFAASAADLVKEGNILATLRHSNVIRIHAVSSKYGVGAYLNGYHDSYFLVLERLERTLTDRIQEWRTRHKELYETDEIEGRYDPESALVSISKSSSSRSWKDKFSSLKRSKSSDDLGLEISDRTNATQAFSDAGSDLGGDDDYTRTAIEKTKLLAERLDVAQQLADAIAYLHSQNVIHRDLKPDNIGFDIHGDLKVFDFDIARVCPTTEDYNPQISSRRMATPNTRDEETFLMTQKVGSPRYMSPEVARREPYNLKADVYSFAVLSHQIMTLQKPYDDITDEDHDELVFYKGVRPFLPLGLPAHTRDLLSKAWSHNISERPNMETVRQIFALERSEILRLGTIGQSFSAMPIAPSTAYVLSCSFEAISDNSKKVKKIKMKNVKQESFKNSKSKNGILSIFRKNLDKPVNKGLLKENPLGRTPEEGMAWARA